MGIAAYEPAYSDACLITHNIPDEGFTAGQAYRFVISTNSTKKVWSVDGLGMVWKVGQAGQAERLPDKRRQAVDS